jgi:hypothetical protein
MRKGKYIDYTILLACLSKKPEPQPTVDEILSKALSGEENAKVQQSDKAALHDNYAKEKVC